MVSTLRIDREGAWYADNNPLIRTEIVRLFAQHLDRDEKGNFEVRLGRESLPVLVEDAPFVITGVLPGDVSIIVLLADGREFELPDGPVRLFDSVPYVSLKWPHDTKISRQAWWQLGSYLHEQDGSYALRYKSKIWPVEEITQP